MRQPENILLVRFSSMGDVLLTTPLIRALRSRLPEARIDYFTKPAFASVLKGNPHLNRVIELPGSGSFAQLRRSVADMKREGKYDLALDLHRNPRSWYVMRSGLAAKASRSRKNRFKRLLLIHVGINLYGSDPAPMAVRYFTALSGIFDPPIGPDAAGAEIFLDDDDRVEASGALGDVGQYVVVAPSARWPTKRWLPERFAAVGDILADRLDAHVVLLGAAEDRELAGSVARLSSCAALNLAGKLSIRGAAAVIEKARAFVGNDTGLMHVAGALGTPGAVVFGPTTRHLGFFPYKSPVKVVENNGLECRPCTKQGQKKCQKKHFRCMEEVCVDSVVDAVIEAINLNS